MRPWLRRLLDRHEDGSKHDWRLINEQVFEPHCCRYDYCGCYVAQCEGCKEKREFPNGVMEMR